MRPDFATEKDAPNLDKLAREGVRFRDHHSIYPTATDVNGAALATGCYPTAMAFAQMWNSVPPSIRASPSM